MLLRVFEVVLDQLAKLGQRFPERQLGRECVVDRWQYLFLYLAQRHGVIGLFPGEFLHWKFIREIDDHQPRFAGF